VFEKYEENQHWKIVRRSLKQSLLDPPPPDDYEYCHVCFSTIVDSLNQYVICEGCDSCIH